VRPTLFFRTNGFAQLLADDRITPFIDTGDLILFRQQFVQCLSVTKLREPDFIFNPSNDQDNNHGNPAARKGQHRKRAGNREDT
jgi:hypothetical protein